MWLVLTVTRLENKIARLFLEEYFCVTRKHRFSVIDCIF